MIQQAQKDGEAYQEKFADAKEVLAYLDLLQFFDHYHLLPDCRQRLDSFTHYLKKSQDLLSSAKQYAQMDSSCKQLHEAIVRVATHKNEKRYKELAVSLIQVEEVVAAVKAEKFEDVQ